MDKLRVPPEFAFVRGIRPTDLPGIAVLEPVVGLFDLPAIADFLVEDSEFVADSVAEGRYLNCCQGLKVTGGKTAESAVAEPRLNLLREYILQVLSQRCKRGAHWLCQAQVYQVIPQMGTQEEL